MAYKQIQGGYDTTHTTSTLDPETAAALAARNTKAAIAVARTASRLNGLRAAAETHHINWRDPNLNPAALPSDVEVRAEAGKRLRNEISDMLGISPAAAAASESDSTAHTTPTPAATREPTTAKLRLNPATTVGREWERHRACADDDPEKFFPIGTSGPALLQIEAAKAVCRPCPVRAECLQWALETSSDWGVWGGMSEDERRNLKRGTSIHQLLTGDPILARYTLADALTAVRNGRVLLDHRHRYITNRGKDVDDLIYQAEDGDAETGEPYVTLVHGGPPTLTDAGRAWLDTQQPTKPATTKPAVVEFSSAGAQR